MGRKGREPVIEGPPPAARSSDELLSSLDDQSEPQPLEPHGDSSSAEEEEEIRPSLPLKSASKKRLVKPIESKTPAASAPSSKRRGGSEAKDEGTAPKRAKRENVEGSHDGGKKPLFQRLWSDTDEIGLLKGMIDYKVQKRVHPLRDVDSFVEFINKSLHVDVNRSQIMSKVRALKIRFQNAKKKTKIADPHGLELFELSKKIWENDLVQSKGKDSNLSTETSNVSILKKEEDKDKVHDWVSSRRGKEEIKSEDFGNFGFLKDGILKEGWDLLDAGEKAEMGKKWKKQNLKEMKLSLKKMDLLREVAQKTLNAMKSA